MYHGLFTMLQTFLPGRVWRLAPSGSVDHPNDNTNQQHERQAKDGKEYAAVATVEESPQAARPSIRIIPPPLP